MKSIHVELVPDEEVGGFSAQVPGIPAYGEGATEEAAISDLKEAVGAYISAFGIKDALGRIAEPSLRTFEVSLEEFARA